jgi:hypothetical protein
MSTRTVFGLRKLPGRFAGLVMPLFLSIFMTCIISLVSTLHGIGPAPGFVDVWLGAWRLSWVIAYPTLLLVLPLVRRATAVVVDLPETSR